MEISNTIRYIGVNDHKTDLFEGQYQIKSGISYNSYLILDDKTAVMDTVDARFSHEWLDALQRELGGRKPDYLIIQHMEPDHSGSIARFLSAYPDATIVSNEKAFAMMQKFFGVPKDTDKTLTVGEGDTLTLGQHTLTFVLAPMVHWPEVMVTYDALDKVLFSADGFGKFGAPDVDEPWKDEARRYYIGIVGKYGPQVQALLKKASGLDIETICPLHGPVLHAPLEQYLNLYQTWSSYQPEEEGVLIAYTSVYGNTQAAVRKLAEKLRGLNCPRVELRDLARTDSDQVVADAFRFSKLVLATTTYNAGLFPYMRRFVEYLTERNFQNRTVGLIENGSWAPRTNKLIHEAFAGSKNITWLEDELTINAAMTEENQQTLQKMAEELCQDYIAQDSNTADKQDMTALFKIGYGLYVVTCRDGERDNGLIVNTVTQVTDTPNRIAVTINKENYSHHVIKQTGKMNINCLSTEAPFAVFEKFGFMSGRNVDKFEGCEPLRSDNGLVFLPRYI
ncbi:MAG: flavin reductase, partial [Clostridia bacterium]|nr:flavin reductase [Clostridia bacterium]